MTIEEQTLNTVQLDLMGIRLEKNGKVDDAILIYEQNIKDSCVPSKHSFDRLLVLYRKSKDYINEKRVCLQAIKVFADVSQDVCKYAKRLEKINFLIGKSKPNGAL